MTLTFAAIPLAELTALQHPATPVYPSDCQINPLSHPQQVAQAAIDGYYQTYVTLGGKLTPIHYPGSATIPMAGTGGANAPLVNMTNVQGISADGTQVCGFYYDGVAEHGFVYTNGVYAQVDLPGMATYSALYGFTTDGQVFGVSDAPDMAHGFKANGTLSLAPHFVVSDQTTGETAGATGTSYNGPVAGLQDQMVAITTDRLNITASTPNVFIHTGSGDDALDVAGGNNVLDGGSGSNFLVGGSGNDTFFVDDRRSSSDIWSTMVNFHKGDAATVWGVTPNDFALNWVADQGAAGYSGLTLHATEAGKPTASLTLSGMSMADLSNGSLQISFGHTNDIAGLTGSSYMEISHV